MAPQRTARGQRMAGVQDSSARWWGVVERLAGCDRISGKALLSLAHGGPDLDPQLRERDQRVGNGGHGGCALGRRQWRRRSARRPRSATRHGEETPGEAGDGPKRPGPGWEPAPPLRTRSGTGRPDLQSRAGTCMCSSCSPRSSRRPYFPCTCLTAIAGTRCNSRGRRHCNSRPGHRPRRTSSERSLPRRRRTIPPPHLLVHGHFAGWYTPRTPPGSSRQGGKSASRPRFRVTRRQTPRRCSYTPRTPSASRPGTACCWFPSGSDTTNTPSTFRQRRARSNARKCRRGSTRR
jgi:hypothetical protein